MKWNVNNKMMNNINKNRQNKDLEEDAAALRTEEKLDEMLANDMDTECRHLHDLNRNISYKIYETGSHPLIVSRAEEIAQLIKDFLMK